MTGNYLTISDMSLVQSTSDIFFGITAEKYGSTRYPWKS